MMFALKCDLYCLFYLFAALYCELVTEKVLSVKCKLP